MVFNSFVSLLMKNSKHVLDISDSLISHLRTCEATPIKSNTLQKVDQEGML